MTNPIVISVAKPLWTAWAMDRELARMNTAQLLNRGPDQLREDLSVIKEAAKDMKPEVVYGLMMDESDELPRPITKGGLAAEGDLYALGETPEEAVEKAESIRARGLDRLQGVLDHLLTAGR